MPIIGTDELWDLTTDVLAETAAVIAAVEGTLTEALVEADRDLYLETVAHTGIDPRKWARPLERTEPL